MAQLRLAAGSGSFGATAGGVSVSFERFKVDYFTASHAPELTRRPMQLPTPDFLAKPILVVGDLVLDRDWSGDTERISREAPVPVVRLTELRHRPGGAGNVAANIVSLGAQVLLCGIVGRDTAGDELLAALQALGADCDGVSRRDGHGTVVKIRVSSRHRQLLRLDFETAPDLQGPDEQGEGFDYRLSLPLLERARVLVISDYGQGAVSQPGELIAAARAKGLPVLADPRGSDFGRYCGASLLTPNRQEFEAVVGYCADETQLLRRGREMIGDLGLPALLITRGEQGMSLLQEGKEPLHIAAHSRDVFDVTGAGDTVIATVAVALASGHSLSDAAALANLTAGIAVSHHGATAVSLTELRAEVRRIAGNDRGVISRAELVEAVADARAAGQRIVFSNGCFDILHAGHIQTLTGAAGLGDKLIVAVNSDASVRRLKGRSRPVNTLERRMEVLAALEVVDWVVAFDEDSPAGLIAELQPELMVKGGDYTAEQIREREVVESYGGELRVLPMVPGHSTTGIIRQLQEDG